jgi:hypothetical protein
VDQLDSGPQYARSEIVAEDSKGFDKRIIAFNTCNCYFFWHTDKSITQFPDNINGRERKIITGLQKKKGKSNAERKG